MANKFSCPHCKADLNPGTKIILRVGSQGRHGLILFSPKVGNYTCVMPKGFALAKGELADFSCPACHADILSGANERLGELLLSRDDGDLMRVNFSRVFGEQATFLISLRGRGGEFRPGRRRLRRSQFLRRGSAGVGLRGMR
jgi:hypothetical protein